MNAEVEKSGIRLSWPAFLSVIAGALSLGGTIIKVIDNDDQRNELKEYMLGEVDGLRSDWERRNKDVDKRLEKLER